MTRLSHSLFLLQRHNAALRTGDLARAEEMRSRIDYADLRNGFRRRVPERVMWGEVCREEEGAMTRSERIAVGLLDLSPHTTKNDQAYILPGDPVAGGDAALGLARRSKAWEQIKKALEIDLT